MCPPKASSRKNGNARSKDEQPPESEFTIKEFSTETWDDFAKLFSQGNGWDHCWCVHFHRPRPLAKENWLAARAARALRNRREQQTLLKQGGSHGILVYADGQPVGWCQYGRREELTRIDSNRNYPQLESPAANTKFWRITCFVVDRKYRRRGIAGLALQAALASIKKQGGGLVEAFPVENWKNKAFGNMSTNGIVSMFRKQGFQIASPFGNTNVVMRKTV